MHASKCSIVLKKIWKIDAVLHFSGSTVFGLPGHAIFSIKIHGACPNPTYCENTLRITRRVPNLLTKLCPSSTISDGPLTGGSPSTDIHWRPTHRMVAHHMADTSGGARRASQAARLATPPCGHSRRDRPRGVAAAAARGGARAGADARRPGAALLHAKAGGRHRAAVRRQGSAGAQSLSGRAAEPCA